MVQYMEVDIIKPATIIFTMLEKVLMVMGEVNTCLRTSLIPPITQVILVDNWGFIVIVMTGVDIGLIPANFILITKVN